MVADKIRAIVANELLRMSDPRLNFVTVTSVVPSPDLRHAKVYWVARSNDADGSASRQEEVSEGFDAAKGLLRRALAEDLGLKFVPDLHFFYDDTLDTVQKVDELFAKINQDRQDKNER